MDSLAAAKELAAAGRHRSGVSRAYYAFYARATAVLMGLTTFSRGREGPSHDDLPDLVYDYLTRLTPAERWRYSRGAERLYILRLAADYRPSQTVDELVARKAVMESDEFFKAMEAAYG